MRRHLQSMAPLALAVTAILAVCASLLVALGSSTAYAEVASLAVEVEEPLSPVSEDLTLDVSGQVSESLVGKKLVVSVRGPVAADQIGQAGTDSGSVERSSFWLGSVPAGGWSADTPLYRRTQESSSWQELREGTLKAPLEIPQGSASEPGAYLVTVDVFAGDEVLASGRVWTGRMNARSTPIDVSFVLPVYLGIHRDWDGTFFDQVLEKATLPLESGTETLRSLLPMAEQLPDWEFTLAIEPILLTQLRDMADGFVFADPAGGDTQVGENDLVAQSAATAVSDLAGLAARDSVEIVAGPYTGADLSFMAEEGWRDGLEAIQMGKSELQSTLGIEIPLGGSYATDLDITGKSLAYYADASVEYVVVGSDVMNSLTEVPAPGTVAVRAENADNDRATLLFASNTVGEVICDPWDVNVFTAAIAAELASVPRDALVVAPKDVYGLIPTEYVREIGEYLTSQSWIRSQKLRDLLDLYSPESRPILLGDSIPEPDGYIEDRLLEAVRAAHIPVSDLGASADPGENPVNQALRSLYVAESRWWSREGTSPSEASMGLAYAEQARTQAQAELNKVTFVKAGAPLISAGGGTVGVTMDNGTDYTVQAELRLAGEGLSFPEGDRVPVELPPGRTELKVEVVNDGGPQKLTGSLAVGTTVVDEFTHALGSVGLWTILPWVLAVIVLLAGVGAYLLIRKRRATSVGGQPE